jgi:hypothetical protein
MPLDDKAKAALAETASRWATVYPAVVQETEVPA